MASAAYSCVANQAPAELGQVPLSISDVTKPLH